MAVMGNKKAAFIEGGGRSRAPYKIDPETGKRIEWAKTPPKKFNPQLISNRGQDRKIGNEIGNILLSGKVRFKPTLTEEKQTPIAEQLRRDFGYKGKRKAAISRRLKNKR